MSTCPNAKPIDLNLLDYQSFSISDKLDEVSVFLSYITWTGFFFSPSSPFQLAFWPLMSQLTRAAGRDGAVVQFAAM